MLAKLWVDEDKGILAIGGELGQDLDGGIAQGDGGHPLRFGVGCRDFPETMLKVDIGPVGFESFIDPGSCGEQELDDC